MQGRMGRTAALRNGFQDELPRSLNLWTFAFLGFWEISSVFSPKKMATWPTKR